MDILPWNVLFLFLCQACFAVNGTTQGLSFNNRQKRSTSSRECQHDGVRVDTKSGSICLCPTGYTGNTCQTETKVPNVLMLSEMNAKDGTVISCELNKVCMLYFNVNEDNFDKSANNIESITITGRPDNSSIKYLKSALVNKITVKFGQLHILSVQTFIQPVDGGPGKMTFSLLQDNNSVDSVSYMFEFVEKLSSIPDIEDGNIPSDSRLVCKDFCRFLLVTKPLPNNECSQVDALCNSAWSLPTFLSGPKCYTEIVFASDPCQKLCLKIRETANTLCYWRFPSIWQSASCGCDALCSNATVEDVCCPQNRSINVCPKPEDGVAAWVIGVGVGASLAIIIAIIATIWCCTQSNIWSRNKVEDFSAESSKVNGVQEKKGDKNETKNADKHKKTPDTNRKKTKTDGK